MLKKWNDVRASSFADKNDVIAFDACKRAGKSDRECFKIGDNGIGCWGHETARTKVAIVALPPDDMIARFGTVKAARDAVVLVRRGNVTIACRLRDRMPWKKNIVNGRGIDLNPAACVALGLKPPVDARVEWRWGFDLHENEEIIRSFVRGFDVARLLGSGPR